MVLSPVIHNVGINAKSNACYLGLIVLFRLHRYSDFQTSTMQLAYVCPAVPSITIMALPSNMADGNRPLLRTHAVYLLPRKTSIE